MIDDIEAGTQTLDSSPETVELRVRQEPEMETQGTETSAHELTIRWLTRRSNKRLIQSSVELMKYVLC